MCRRKEKGRSREGVKLTEVVRDDDDTALVLLDRACERIDGGHVQVVRRLVQEEDVWVLHRELREHDSATPHDTHAHITRAEEMWEKRRDRRLCQLQLYRTRWAPNGHSPVPETVRELLDGRRLVCARETKAAELCTPSLHILVRELLVVERLEVLDRRLLVWELVGRVLRVLGELQADVPRDRALGRLQRTRDEVEQRRLAGTVLTDDGDARVHAVRGRYMSVYTICWEDEKWSTHSIPKERFLYR